jgi:hypothetical protein
MVLYFCSLSKCTSTSKLRHLACQVSSIYLLKNFYSIFFKHLVTDSISSLCLTSVVVNTFSCRIVAFFISSTTQMIVSSTITNFYCRAFKVSLISFFSTWVFSSFYWVSWSYWSNYLWANTRLALFFSHSFLWASNSRGSIWCATCSYSYIIVLYRHSNSKESWILFP